VLVFGAGGLGHPVSFFLSRSPLISPRILICDGDAIQRSNLNRQFLFNEGLLGKPKAQTLAAALGGDALGIDAMDDPSETRRLITDADYVVDATDSIRHKFLCNDLCVELKKPFAYAGVIGEGGLFLEVRPGGACLRCVFGDYTEEDLSREQASCQSAGILGAVCGMFGALAAGAVENYLIGDETAPELVRFNPKEGIQRSAVRRDASCRNHP